MSGYAELAVTSNFSFLRGGSHPEELAAQATELGLTAIGIADRNTVAGLVRAHSVAKERELQFPPGARLLPGVRLVFADGTPEILAYPNCLSGWSNLTRLLTIGKRRAEKGECELCFTDLLERAAGLSLIVVAPPHRRLDASSKLLSPASIAARDAREGDPFGESSAQSATNG